MSIGSIVGLAAGKISDLLVQEAKLLYGVKDQVLSLETELTTMNAFLTDMEARDEEGGDVLSRTIINDIRKIAYDVEDVIDSYILDASFPPNKMEAFFERYVCFCCPSLLLAHQVGSEIKAIKDRLVETLGRWREYAGPNVGIDAGSGLNRDSQRLNRGSVRRPITYSHTEEQHVVGLEEDINKLVGLLTTGGADIQVISILGMGGSGKTTLARKLYNHRSVKGHFDCIAWLSISQEWVPQQILLELLRQASRETMRKDEVWSLQALVGKLHRYLEGKMYLIVLDDVWTKETFEAIIPALPNDGRRIIITTRKREVIDFPNVKSFVHEPRRLTEEESWDLFRKIALAHDEENINSMDIGVLKALGKEMLKKCEGLPLAVIALAGILRKKKTIENWEKVNKAVSAWIMAEEGSVHLYGPVNKMLTLSYNDLDRHLKPCFLYLAMYPEDTEIQIGQLIKLWIAEGFITSQMCKEGETLEDVARDYSGELIDRCMVQIASNNYKGCVKSIRIHDLVRDLCIKKAKKQVFLKMSTSQSSHSDSRETELRRTAIYCLDENYPPLPTQSLHLRSLIYEGVNFYLIDRPPTVVSLKNIDQHFRLLKVLYLKSVETLNCALPKEIGRLIHLRYLGLMLTNIRELPASIGNLRNLLTLDCRHVQNTPDVLWKIEGLRHLHLGRWTSIKGRVKLDSLKQLQTLKGIGGGSWMLEQLPLLSPTLQKVQINCISSKEQLEAAFRCPSITSDSLHSLSLEWSVYGVVLENLQPLSHCQHLWKLLFNGRMEDRLRNCNQFPTCILKLVLVSTCLEEAELAALGKRLPNLMYLWLGGDAYVGAKWSLMVDQFQRLKELHLQSLFKWEEWSIERGAVPQLTKLVIDNCSKLRRLPEGLKFITTLQQLTLTASMGEELKKRAEGGEDAHLIQHVPLVHISYW